MTILDGEINETAQKIVSTIERASSKELMSSNEVMEILHLTDVHHAKSLLQHMSSASTQSERNISKIALVEALLLSTWLQRLYFVIRSTLMGLLSAAITFSFILVFGSINFFLEVILGIVSFIFALTVSRRFDKYIVTLTRGIIVVLSSHKKLRAFIINHF